jgi:predicted Zn-dependent protease
VDGTFFTQILLFIIVILLPFSAIADESQTQQYYLYDLHKTVYIDKDFTKQQKEDINKALLSWEESTAGLVKFKIISDIKLNDYSNLNNFDNTLFITPVSKENSDIINIDDKSNNGLFTVGLCISKSYTQGMIVDIVVERTDKTDFKAIVLHEVGHALGLKHIISEHSVMNPNVSASGKKIGQIDLYVLCELYHCNSNKMQAINH